MSAGCRDTFGGGVRSVIVFSMLGRESTFHMSFCPGLKRLRPHVKTIEKIQVHTFIPSSEKHGGTAELSSSASLRRMGNFSTADMGMSPR